MREGHTIHRVALDHLVEFTGVRLRVSSPQGRFSQEAALLNSQSIESVEACGKHLFYLWNDGPILHVHLGLYGRFLRHASPPPEPRGTVRVRIEGPKCTFDLRGPAACELLDANGRDRIIDRLGADPLRPDADLQWLRDRVGRRRAPIRRLLLNQGVFAGVGNIFRSESLFAVGLYPKRPGRSLSDEEFD